MKTAQQLVEEGVTLTMKEHGCGRTEAVEILLAKARVAPEVPEERAHSLSARTKQIQQERGISFAAAQKEASKDFRRMFVRAR